MLESYLQLFGRVIQKLTFARLKLRAWVRREPFKGEKEPGDRERKKERTWRDQTSTRVTLVTSGQGARRRERKTKRWRQRVSLTSAHFLRSLRGKLQNKQHGGREQRACIVERRRGTDHRDGGDYHRRRHGADTRRPQQERGLHRAWQETAEGIARRRHQNGAEAGAPLGRYPLLRSLPWSTASGCLSGKSSEQIANNNKLTRRHRRKYVSRIATRVQIDLASRLSSRGAAFSYAHENNCDITFLPLPTTPLIDPFTKLHKSVGF